MSHSTLSVRRVVAAALGAGALSGAMLFGGAALASADPDAPVPPPCSAAELARVMSGISFDTSNYLIAHPDVNDFFTGLKGQPKADIGRQVEAYYAANPTVEQELKGLRQPAIDFRARCGLPLNPTP
ncbi:MAG: heme-binding protein [Mycobacterium sp.]